MLIQDEVLTNSLDCRPQSTISLLFRVLVRKRRQLKSGLLGEFHKGRFTKIGMDRSGKLLRGGSTLRIARTGVITTQRAERREGRDGPKPWAAEVWRMPGSSHGHAGDKALSLGTSLAGCCRLGYTSVHSNLRSKMQVTLNALHIN